MQHQKCFASNTTIARLLKCSPSSIPNALGRLERQKYIHREYDENGTRTEIIPLVCFGDIPDAKEVRHVTKSISHVTKGFSHVTKGGSSGDEGGLSQVTEGGSSGDEQNSNIIIVKENSNNYPSDQSVDPLIPGGKNNPTPDEIVRVIDMFKELLPGEFSGSKNVFAIPTIRKAVAGAISAYGFDGIKNLVEDFTHRRHDKYAPSVGTIYEFCTTKLAKIEQFVNKSTRPDSPAFRKVGATGKVLTPREQELADSIRENIRKKNGR